MTKNFIAAACLITLAFLPIHAQTVSFSSSNLNGESLNKPTSLQFGPDGRLYVSQQDGKIFAYTVTRNGANNYQVTATETISLIQQIPNHNDNGTPNSSVNTRQVTGILVAGTATVPIIFVTSSDPRIGGNSAGTDTNLDTNSGMISRLTKSGSSWTKIDLVQGLPRSEENHSCNGLAYDAVNNVLYMAQGGHTNMGAPSNNFALTPEYALSTAILKINLTAIGNTTYKLPTLDDDTRNNVSGAQAGHVDPNDPFGGNDGKNQAMLVSGGPVQVYSPGWRNNYDVIITQAGKMYSFDNGPNTGWGGTPTNCTNAVKEPGTGDCDVLHHVTQGYYAGHANPTRGNRSNTFNSNQQTPVPVGMQNSIECTYQTPSNQPGAIHEICTSTNGMGEYTASNFGNAMKGNLLACGFNGNIYRFKLNSTGTALASGGFTTLASNLGSTPLDVTTQGDNAIFPGTIWICTYGANNIAVLEPVDFSSCTGDMNSFSLDFDNDGYSNGDETTNGTNPCSAASKPADFDNDKISNLNDPDDDNDGINDLTDKFARDASNGTTKTMPINLIFDNSDQGGILGWGFTGLMTNGGVNYETLYNPDNMTVGGAAFKFTVDAVPAGDAIQGLNTQMYAFQTGVNVSSAQTFVAHSRVMGPFAGFTPSGSQSMGLFIGTGDEDNYLKIVASANSGAGGIEVLKEQSAAATGTMYSIPILNKSYVDLYLYINKSTNQVQPKYSIEGGAQTDLGTPVAIPASWVSSIMAAGFISTSINSTQTFPATWDYLKVQTVTNTPGLPQVSITSPSNNSVFSAPANVTINANASSTNGSISKVDFYLNNSLVFSDNSSPYSHSLTSLSSGSYSVYAIATDNINATATSSTVNFTVGSAPTGASALLVVGNTSLSAGDQSVFNRLQTLGFAVTTVSGSASTASHANGKNIVFISSTINSGDVNTKFANVTVPVIACESFIFDDMKMTGTTASTHYGSSGAQSAIAITNSSHPLAGGLPAGNVTVYNSSNTMVWGNPGGSAIKIANIMGNAAQTAIFGFETGTAMVGMNAPARRVGFFTHDGGASPLTQQGLQLLDAAITWAAASGSPPADCNGVPGGSAFLDDCGVCSGGNTGHVANSDKDACGVCFGNGSSCNTPDCNGVPGGSAFLDDCGVCSGGNTGHVANSDKDACGVCFGNGSSCNTPDCNGVPGGSAFLDDCGVCSGGNTGHVANSDKDVCGVCFGNGSSCGGACQPLQVVSLTLVKTGTAGDIGLLTNGMTIFKGSTGSINVRANICPGSTSVKSVKFFLNGALAVTENVAPYAIAGDQPAGNYKTWNVNPGTYALAATPYSGANGSGTVGVSYSVNITVSNASAKTELSEVAAVSTDEKLRFYPNPNTGSCTIELYVPEQNNLNIRVYNQLGQIVYSHTKMQFSGELKEQLSLNDQPTGIYFLQLTSGDKTFNEKVIINR